MKFFIVLALAVIGASAAPNVGDDVDPVDRMQKAIDGVLAIIPEPLLNLQDKKANVNLGFEQMNFTFTNLVVSGIKNLASTLAFDKDTGIFDFEFNWETIDVQVEFDVLLAGILEGDHNPVISLTLTNAKFSGAADIDTSGSPHQLTDLKYIFTLGGAEVSLTRILNDDALSEKLQTLLNEQLPSMASSISTQIEPVVGPIAKSIINIILRATN